MWARSSVWVLSATTEAEDSRRPVLRGAHDSPSMITSETAAKAMVHVGGVAGRVNPRTR